MCTYSSCYRMISILWCILLLDSSIHHVSDRKSRDMDSSIFMAVVSSMNKSVCTDRKREVVSSAMHIVLITGNRMLSRILIS